MNDVTIPFEERCCDYCICDRDIALRAENRELAAKVAVLMEWAIRANGHECVACGSILLKSEGHELQCPFADLPAAAKALLDERDRLAVRVNELMYPSKQEDHYTPRQYQALLDRLAILEATATEWGKRIVVLEHERDEAYTRELHLKDRLAQAERERDDLRTAWQLEGVKMAEVVQRRVEAEALLSQAEAREKRLVEMIRNAPAFHDPEMRHQDGCWACEVCALLSEIGEAQ